MTTTIAILPTSPAYELVFEPDAAEFCKKQNTLDLVHLAARIVSRNISIAGSITVELQMDPDSDTEDALLVIPVTAPADEIQRQYQAYVKEWIESVPAEMILRIPIFLNVLETKNDPS